MHLKYCPSFAEPGTPWTACYMQITLSNAFQTRVKKVMQSDEDIGRMVASVPVAIGSAMEHFAERLLEAAAHCVQFSTSRTLSPGHMYVYGCAISLKTVGGRG